MELPPPAHACRMCGLRACMHPREPGAWAPISAVGDDNTVPCDDTDLREEQEYVRLFELGGRIDAWLASRGLGASVDDRYFGPVVNVYVVGPDDSVPLDGAMSGELALALGEDGLRIRREPEDGGRPSIVIPARLRGEVDPGGVFAAPAFYESTAVLPVGLGISTHIFPVVVDLAAMPHLLIGGIGGSGKTTLLRAILTSLLQRSSARVRIALVDTYKTELAVFAGIPQLVGPIVTDPHEAPALFRWAVREARERVERLARAGALDIDTYNAQLPGAVDAAGCSRDELPRVVLAVDDLAPVMTTGDSGVEANLVRLAVAGPAVGIHMVLATIHPASKVVLPDTITSAIPSRIALTMASRVESRLFLGSPGAEELLGRGDLLFTDRGAPPRRLHAPIVVGGEAMEDRARGGG